MKWSSAPYEAGGKTLAAGDTAAALRSLDAFDPTSPARAGLFTQDELCEELVNYLKGVRWCAPLGKLVVARGLDMSSLEDEDRLTDYVLTFLSARVMWAQMELARYPDEKRVKDFAKAARAADGKASKMLIATVKRRIRISPEKLDALPWAIGTPTGVLSLESGALVSDEGIWLRQPEGEAEEEGLFVTKSVRAPINSNVTREYHRYDPRWDAFIYEICDGDAEKAAFLQRALGYSLYGGNPEKATFVLWSRKRNCGKSTLMAICKNAMGDYAGSAPIEMVLKTARVRDYSAPNPVLVELKGKRLVDMSEPPMGAALDGAALKKLASGQDKVVARGLHKDPVEYVPEFAPWIHCNSLPIVDDPTAVDPNHAFVIEFTRSFEGADRDTHLVERFETPDGMFTVLCWMLRGYAAYGEQGLNPPASVRDATESWLVASGTWLDDFVTECCVLDVRERYPLARMRQAIEAYRESIGGERMSKSAVDGYLKLLNVPNTTSHGTRIFKGITLSEDAERRLLPEPKGDDERLGRTPNKPTIPLR